MEEEEERRKKRQIKKGASSCRTLGSIVILIFKKIKCDVWFKLFFDLRTNCSPDEDEDEVVSSQQRIFAIFPENETNGSD